MSTSFNKIRQRPSTPNAHIASLSDQLPTLFFYLGLRDDWPEIVSATLKGDWEKVIECFGIEGIGYNSQITMRGETALHIAVAANQVDFVKHLMHKMAPEDVTMVAYARNTAMCTAALRGKVESVKMLLHKYSELTSMRGLSAMLPLHMAASAGYVETVRLLYSVTKPFMDDNDKINIFVLFIHLDLYDLALDMFYDDPILAFQRDQNQETALHAFAQKSSLTPPISDSDELAKMKSWKDSIPYIPILNFMIYNRSVIQKRNIMRNKAFRLAKLIWEQVVIMEDTKISRLIGTPWRLLFVGAQKGNVDLLSILIHSYPDLIYRVTEQRYSIFHIAIMYRQEGIFKLIYEFYSAKDAIFAYTDGAGNNMLHLAAKLPLTEDRLRVVSGAALQLQRELLWFKEVRKIFPNAPRFHAKAHNMNRETPEDFFVSSHKYLLKEGGEWMRGTADKCMIVATLVATVVFASAFTVPGGNGQDNGIPIFLRSVAFKFFFLADAVSLVSSVAAVIIFLGIMTSRYQLSDFHKSLPQKLIMGLGMLLISLAAMLMAFVAAAFVVFDHHGLVMFAIPIAAIVVLPLGLFVWMHLRLCKDIYVQTYMPGSIFKRQQDALEIAMYDEPFEID